MSYADFGRAAALPPGEYRMPGKWNDRYLVVEGLGEIHRTSFWRGSATGTVFEGSSVEGSSVEMTKKGAFRTTYFAHDPGGFLLGELTMGGFARRRGVLAWRGVEYRLQRTGAFREVYSLGRAGTDGILEVRRQGIAGNSHQLTVGHGEPVDPALALFVMWAVLQIIRQNQAAASNS